MVEFQFPCPHCATKIACEPGYTGWQINCPACQQALVVPSPGGAVPPAGGAPAYPPGAPMGGATAPSSQRSGLALAALLLSVLGLPGIICGHMAINRLQKNPQLTGGPLALTGLIIGYVSLALMITVGVILGLGKSNSSDGDSPALTTSTPKTGTGKSVQSAIIWNEDFESDLNQWKNFPKCSAMTSSDQQNHSSNGSKSAKVNGTSDRMYRDIGAEMSAHAKLSFWFYDEKQPRAFGEVRAYASAGFDNSQLQQVFSIGRYEGGFVDNTGTLVGEVMDTKRYHGRVVGGANTGWFNLDAPGAPNRSTGWHQFEIERMEDGTTVKFYVDGVLGREVHETLPSKWRSVVIGSVGATTSSPGEAWFDDVKVESLGGITIASLLPKQ